MSAPTNLDQWLKQGKRHPFYDSSCTHYTDLRVHAYGEYPKNLIDERRPTESENIQEFRKKIYVGATEGAMSKVIYSLSQIRKSNDYVIKFDTESVPSSVKDDETLEKYTSEYFPKFKSLDNWIWDVCLPAYCIDPNAISITLVQNTERKSNEYVKPYPVIFHSDNIYDYKEGEFYFVKSDEISWYVSNKQQREGDTYYYIDSDSVTKYSQINYKGEFKIETYAHNLTYPPVVHLKAIVKKDINAQTLYRSRLAPMLPWLKEAVREYSDLQAGVLQSMFPSYWYYGSTPCTACKGTGEIPKANSAPVKCSKCKGKGDFPFNPYEHISISLKRGRADEQPVPTPPGGIIEKDTKIIEIQERRIDGHLYRSFQSVNMEHLAQVPLSQSGVAKEHDRAEAFNFKYAVAEDIVCIMDYHYKIINDMRYSVIIADEKKRSEMLPEIPVPTKYSDVTEMELAEQTKMVKDSGMIAAIFAACQLEYTQKHFNTSPDLQKKVMTILELDPLAGMSGDELFSGADSISDEDKYIHWNINKLVDEAMIKDPDFLTKTLEERKEVISAAAQEGMKVLDKAEQVKMKLEAKRTEMLTNAAGNNTGTPPND